MYVGVHLPTCYYFALIQSGCLELQSMVELPLTCEIRGSWSSNYETYRLECDAVWSGRWLPTFRKKVYQLHGITSQKTVIFIATHMPSVSHDHIVTNFSTIREWIHMSMNSFYEVNKVKALSRDSICLPIRCLIFGNC
jgi:hypothetical protein